MLCLPARAVMIGPWLVSKASSVVGLRTPADHQAPTGRMCFLVSVKKSLVNAERNYKTNGLQTSVIRELDSIFGSEDQEFGYPSS